MTIPTLRGPGELLATLPLILGFTPVESVVVVSIRADGEIGAIMRLDRDDCLLPDVLESMARAVAAHLTRDRAHAAILVTYTQQSVRLCCDAADALRAALTDVVPRIDGWAVSAGRYFAPGCADVLCCPLEGSEVPAAHALAMHQAGSWRAAVTHSSTRKSWGGAPPQARRRCARAADRWLAKRAGDEAQWRQDSLEQWQLHLVNGLSPMSELREADMGKLVAGLSDVRVRDAVIVWLVPGSSAAIDDVLAGIPSHSVALALDAVLDPHQGLALDDAQADALRRVIGACVAHARRRDAPPLLAVLALVQWWAGESEAALAACDAASTCAPGYRLAGLIQATILAGIRPGWLA